MACRFELGAQLAEVVDLAVEHDPDGTVLVVDRLMAGREIDDAQAPHAERDALVDEHAFIVGAAMADHVAHAVDERARLVRAERRGRGWRFYEASDAAHMWSLVVGRWALVRRKS